MLDDTRDTLRGKNLEWHGSLLVGAVVAVAVFYIATSVGSAILNWQSAPQGFGASSETIEAAWDAALVEIIGALAGVGTAVILTVRQLIVDRIVAWWGKKETNG